METHSTGSESEKALSSAPPEIDAAVEDNPEFSPHSRESGGAISAQTERTNWSAQAHKANLPDPPNEAVYYGLAGEFVSAVEPYTEADPVALLVQLLAAFGCAAGKGIYRTVERDRHHLNVFVILVGDTAKARKGSAWSWPKHLLERADPDFIQQRYAGGLSSGEGLIWAVRDEGSLSGNSANSCRENAVADKRLLVHEGEFSAPLRAAARHDNTLSETIRRAWDGNQTLQILTKNSPAHATGAHISIVAHITAEELRARLDDTEVANGFANRFLFFHVHRSKLLPFPPDTADLEEKLNVLAERLKAALDFAKMEREMEFSAEARELWCSSYQALSEGSPGLLGAVTARAEAQVLRLALLYAALDCSAVIERVHLEAALALWGYAERSAAYIFGDKLGNPDADVILDALRRCGPCGLTRTQLRDLFGRNLSAERIERALALLRNMDKARCEQQRSENGGRPTETWFATFRAS
jgi:hypothetical protein